MSICNSCNCERNCIDVNLEAYLPSAKISCDNVKVLMISEALPKNISDYFYTTEEAAFLKQLALQ